MNPDTNEGEGMIAGAHYNAIEFIAISRWLGSAKNHHEALHRLRMLQFPPAIILSS